MFIADVEIDTGESLPVMLLDGHFAGKSILAFIVGCITYCDKRSGDKSLRVPPEFERFSPRAMQTLCPVCADLMKATINGDWDYCEGEDYQSYVTRTSDYELEEYAFEAAVAHYRGAWTDLQTLIARVQTVIVQLETAPPSDQADQLASGALVDFRALHDTLEAAMALGATRARIDIH